MSNVFEDVKKEKAQKAATTVIRPYTFPLAVKSR